MPPRAKLSDDHAVLHLRDLVRADHAARLVGQRRVHGDDVGLGEQRRARRAPRRPLGRGGGDVRIVGDDAHAERARRVATREPMRRGR